VKIKRARSIRQSRSDHCTITSPIDGVVICAVSRWPDSRGRAAGGQLFLPIANDLTKMQIDAQCGGSRCRRRQVDQNVDFTVDAFPMQTFQGKVVQVRNAPITVQNLATLRHRHWSEHPDLKLKPE